MRDTKLFQHLMLLSDHDRKAFRRYLASPYFNAIPRLVQLFDAFDQNLIPYKLRQLKESQLWALYLPELPYDQNRLRKDCTSLVQQLIDFWAQQQFDEDKPQRCLYLLQRLNDLGEVHYFPNYSDEAKARLVSFQNEGKPDFSKRIDLGIQRYQFDLNQNTRMSNVALEELVLASELQYCVYKMEILYIELNHHLVTGKGMPKPDREFLTLFESKLPQLPALTQMYFHIFNCTQDLGAEGEYQAFRTLLKQAQFPENKLKDMYTAALNYGARRLNSGDGTYLKETHQLHREMLTLGLMKSKNQLLTPNFKNAVMVACKAGELSWAKVWMRYFDVELKLDANKAAFHFGWGVIAYYEQELAKAEIHFYRVLDNVQDIYYGLDARGFLLRIYYETENLISLDSLLESYRMYLKRDKQLPSIRKAGFQTFIRFLRQVAHCNPHDKTALKRLQFEIQNGRKIPMTAWLLEKVSRLLGE